MYNWVLTQQVDSCVGGLECQAKTLGTPPEGSGEPGAVRVGGRWAGAEF